MALSYTKKSGNIGLSNLFKPTPLEEEKSIPLGKEGGGFCLSRSSRISKL
jgi:hypothetical protein